MASQPRGKQVRFEIETTQEFLGRRGLSIEDVKGATSILARSLGLRYERMFPLHIQSHDIDRIIYVASILKAVENFSGFKRHTSAYSKETLEDHLFTAKTAAWLASRGQKVEFEPPMPEGMGAPDLKCEANNQHSVFFECKRIRTDKFFDLNAKQQLADLVYDKLATCDQLDFYLLHDGSAAKVKQLISDKSFATLIFAAGMRTKQSEINVDGQFRVRIIQRPAIIGAEDDFLTARIQGWLQDAASGVRLPGFTFMRGGRSIGIHGPPPNYRRIWNRKRSRSKAQSVPDHPFVVILSDEDVMGDPAEHSRFFEGEWLTGKNTEVSGIGFLSFAQMVGEREDPKFSYRSNPNAKHPLPEDYFS